MSVRAGTKTGSERNRSARSAKSADKMQLLCLKEMGPQEGSRNEGLRGLSRVGARASNDTSLGVCFFTAFARQLLLSK